MHWSAVIEGAALTLVWVLGSLFKPLRERGWEIWQLFANCPLCIGVWVGSAVVLARFRWGGAVLEEPVALTVLAHGAAAGVLALVVKLVVMWLDAH